jgi:type II secretory pathway pseudopilin PulG
VNQGRSIRLPASRGYTIVELMVAMAITSFMLIVLLSLVAQSSSLYDRTQRAVNSLSQARAFMQFFEGEVATRLPTTPLLHETSSPGVSLPAHRIAFVHTVGIDEQMPNAPGDLGTSTYYVAFSPDAGGLVSPKLFRRFLDPVETQALLDAGAAPPFPEPAPELDEFVVENVLAFELDLQFSDPVTVEWREWNVDSPEPPGRMIVRLRFLDHAIASRFTTEAEWNRLATAPSNEERRYIREFEYPILLSR